MNTLAQALLHALEASSTVEEPGLDTDECADITNDMWGQLAAASPSERQALADAAKARLALLRRDPDEHGHSPRQLVTPDQKELLESIADGSAFHELDEASDDAADDA